MVAHLLSEGRRAVDIVQHLPDHPVQRSLNHIDVMLLVSGIAVLCVQEALQQKYALHQVCASIISLIIHLLEEYFLKSDEVHATE